MQDEFPYYGTAQIIGPVNDFLFIGHYLLVIEGGTVITAGGKPVLQFMDGKFWVNNHTQVILGTGNASTAFLFLHLSECEIGGYITGAAPPKITQSAMNKVPVWVETRQLRNMFDRIVGEHLRLKGCANRRIEQG